jgi:hypothetical protein
MRRRHDAFLKLLYRVGARDAVALFFPHLAVLIDWSEIRWVEKEIPIRRGRGRARSVVADLVGLTRDVEGRYLEVYLHPEIQMQPDAEMDWRVLQYNAGLLLQEGSSEARVLTVVFYHCRGGGEIGRRERRLEFYGDTTLAVGYWAVGIGDLEAAEYLGRENPMAWALASWMQQPRRERAEQRLQLQERILRSAADEYYQRLLLDAVQTYYRLNAAERAEEEHLRQTERYREVSAMMDTVLGRLEAAAEQRGEQNALLKMLQSRFGTLSETLEARVRRVEDVAALTDLIGRATTAESLEEVEALLP